MTTMTSLSLLLPVILVGIAQSVPSYVLETYFIVEPQVTRRYMEYGYDRQAAEANLRGDIDFVINEVNKYFESMQPSGLSIEVRTKKLLLMDEELFDNRTLVLGKQLPMNQTFERIFEYLADENAFHTVGYDLAVVWTGYDVTMSSGGNRGVKGYAYMNGACHSRESVTFLEFTGTQETAIITAHEIAHSLGAHHDFRTNDYLMGSLVPADSKHRWSFSNQSIQSIREFMDKLDASTYNCLLNTTTPSVTFNLSRQLGRDILDPSKMCQRFEKVTSHFCNELRHTPIQEDKLCQVLHCSPHDSLIFCRNSGYPTEGMLCAVGKRCSKGRCLPAPTELPTPANITPDCLYGDWQGRDALTNYKSCEQHLKEDGLRICKSSRICCKSCAEKRKGIKDCEYGDMLGPPICTKDSADKICNTVLRKFCCSTCKNYKEKRSAIESDKDLSPLQVKNYDMIERQLPVDIAEQKREKVGFECGLR